MLNQAKDLKPMLESLCEGEPKSLEELRERVSAIQSIVCALSEQLERGKDQGSMSAEEMYRRSKSFKDNNPLVWDRIVYDARRAARNKERFSMKKEIEDLRAAKWVRFDENEKYKFQNSYTATLTRFLFQEVPEVKPYVRINSSKTDKFFGGHIDGK